MRITFEGVEYEVEIKGAGHGQWHIHEEPHPDGSPGEPQHHHGCTVECETRTAVLRPVAPTFPKFDSEAEPLPVMLYRWRLDDGAFTYSPDAPPEEEFRLKKKRDR